MNKYEKAFDVIETILHLMCGEEREDGYKPSHDEMVNSMEDFKELVERATPKKIITDGSAYSTCDKVQYICPNCKKIMLRAVCARVTKPNYCYNCGQALDWRYENVD